MKHIPVSNIFAAVFIGGLLYPITSIGMARVCYHQPAFSILNSAYVPLFLISIGSYLSFSKLEKWALSLLTTMVLILLIYLLIRFYTYGSLVQALDNGFGKFFLVASLFGFLGGGTKVTVLKSRMPEFQKSKEQIYLESQNDRMNPIIRLLGCLMGSLFVLFPFFIFFQKTTVFYREFQALGMSSQIFFILMVIGTFIMGLFFLAYCISGRTPKFILEHLKKTIKKNE